VVDPVKESSRSALVMAVLTDFVMEAEVTAQVETPTTTQ
jgi:hypothetical protein